MAAPAEDGHMTGAGPAVAEMYGCKFDKLWAATKERAKQELPTRRDALPRLEVHQLREVSRGFPASTAVATDGLTMRPYQLLCDDALQVLATIFEAFEVSTVLRPQWGLLDMPLLRLL